MGNEKLDKGFHLVPRSLYNDPLYEEMQMLVHKKKRVVGYYRFQALQDIFRRANYHDSEVSIQGVKTIITRGQLFISVEKLAYEWGWSRHRVYNLLTYLEHTRDTIGTQKGKKHIIITIRNYDEYQTPSNYNQENGDTTGTRQGQGRDKKGTHPKELKELKELKKKDIKDVFDFWNEQGMHKHTKITSEMESHVGARIKDFGIETVMEAIKNYERILHGNNFVLTYTWTLIDFTKSLNRFEKFLTYNRPYHQYLNTKKMSEPQLESWLVGINKPTIALDESPEDVKRLVAESLKQMRGK